MSFPAHPIRAALALAALAAAAPAAQAHERLDRGEILSELPQGAAPGECFAKVAAPTERLVAPPQLPGSHWTVTPSPIGPIWCLVTDPGRPAQVETIMRYGWIRVLCDDQATPARLTHIQHRLHDRGFYQGDYSGRFDEATAAAVGRFQSSAQLRHGGYLSLETLDALGEDGGDGYPPPPPPPPPELEGGAAYASGYGDQDAAAYAGQGGYADGGAADQGYVPPPVFSPPVARRHAHGDSRAHSSSYAASSYSSSSYTSGGYAGGYGATDDPGQGYAPGGYGEDAGFAQAYAPPLGPPAMPCCIQPVAPPPPTCCGMPAFGPYAGTGVAYGSGFVSGYTPGFSPYNYGYPAPTPAYAADHGPVVNGWLTWPGKTGF